jgi:Spy/CpxP family protein refolding chaperone
MKNLILTALIAFSFIAGVNAQGPFSQKDRIKEMKDNLALTDKQVKKIESIFDKTQKKMKTIDASGQDRMEAMKKVMEANDAQIESILTAKQKVKYKAMMAERRSRMGNMPPPNGGMPPNNGN